jgi:Spy/CpxP family protein refolding chaperone
VTASRASAPGQRLAQALNLTPDQQAKLKALQYQFRDQLKSLRDAHRQQVLSILTPDQAAKLQSLQANRKDRFQGRMKHRGFGLAQKLNLTADQQAQIAEIMKSARAQRRRILSSAQSGGDASAVRVQLQSLRQSVRSRIDSVLTPEQRDQLPSRSK